MVSRLLPALLAAALLPGCFRLTEDDLDAALDPDGDGEPSTAYGGNDCAPNDATVHPGAAEVCDGIDNNCDGQVDEGAAAPDTWWADADADGYGDPAAPLASCEPPPGHVDNDDDCDDSTAAASPDGREICDDLDNDCDGSVDEDADGQQTFWADDDDDGYGDPDETLEACSLPTGYAANDADCDDLVQAVNPGADEVCDGVDNDCDDSVDEDDAVDAPTWYTDVDGDGYGRPDGASEGPQCDPPAAAGWADNALDCDDTNDDVHPGEPEVCDGADNDCDGQVDFEQNVPADHAYIQNAIDAATTGDRVCVLEGDYSEVLVIDDDISLYGEDRDRVVLTAVKDSTILEIRDTTSAPVVSGLTFWGGAGQQGGALRVDDASPHVTDVAFRWGDTEFLGQCLGTVAYLSGAGAASFEDVYVGDNSAACGETVGMFLVTSTGGVVTFDRIDLRDNLAEAATAAYGAIYAANGAEVSVTNAIFAGNLHSWGLGSATVGAEMYGMAISATDASTVDLTNAVIVGNVNDAGTGTAWSAGVYLDISSSGTMTNTTVSDNEADGAVIEATAVYGPMNERYSNVWNQDDPIRTGGDPLGINGNIAQPPDFRDTSGVFHEDWDLRLDPTAPSALIDAGDPALLDPDGSTSDIGAYGGPGASW